MAPESSPGEQERQCSGVVTVLCSDGKVLEFPQRIQCSELLASFPCHAVCPASALLLKQEGKMLQGDSFLESGHMYFLVPIAKPSDVPSSSAENAPQSSMRFKISREYLSRILEDGGFNQCASSRSPPGIVEKRTPAESELDYGEARYSDRDVAFSPEYYCDETWDNGAAADEEQASTSTSSVVAVLQYDGKVLEFPERIKCSELLASFPSHAVCPATALVSKQQGKMLESDSFLEPGRTYFLVPRPRHGASAEALPNGSMRFKISKEYLARILAEAGVASTREPRPPRSARMLRIDIPPREQDLKRLRAPSKASRVSPLASIPEIVPA